MFFEDTFVLLRAVARRAGIGHVLCNVAEAWRADGGYAAAREALDRALALFRDIGDPLGTAVALNALGNLARSTGEYTAGRAWFEQALRLRRAAYDQREIGTTLAGAGLLALYAGDADGHRLIGQAVRMFARTSDGPGMQLTPLNVAGFELDRGDPQVACEMLERIAAREENVYVRSRGWAAAELADAALAIGDRDRARRAAASALASFESLGEARGVRYVRGLDTHGEWLLSARP
jgi:tetratricopeptide (TPR) repeat protein